MRENFYLDYLFKKDISLKYPFENKGTLFGTIFFKYLEPLWKGTWCEIFVVPLSTLINCVEQTKLL